jgi:hypothetical protein
MSKKDYWKYYKQNNEDPHWDNGEEEVKEKSLAKQINENLDKIIYMRREAERMDNDLDDDQILNNINTGEKQSKLDALNIVEGLIIDVKNELNQITNNGKNVRDIFTNKYYVNDMLQDKECLEEELSNNLKTMVKPKDINAN